MSVRSTSGFLATVLAVSALATLGLDALRPPTIPPSADGVAGQAWLLYGGWVVLTVLVVGVGVWSLGCLIEAAVGTRGARVAAVALLIATPPLVHQVEDAYWDARSWGTAWREDGRKTDTLVGTWRGLAGGECGYFTVLRVHLDADGEGIGTAVPMYIGTHLSTAMIALSPLDGPLAIPVRASVRDGLLTTWSTTPFAWGPAGTEIGTVRIVEGR